ncbi:polysaccharide deacetylase [Parasphingopyxis algicola]|uniref:polysaccharide deacetylase family protein n=1 Tax=Parasphingopyxis algicola TaxID=2026624 RepID=UPI0015A29D84|nr:polysaccharide deacetylase family protein [Parasphingopyxis algicola]QLC26375.1 polysaccharide deacetylase [Parasphingopyxis algicola]
MDYPYVPMPHRQPIHWPDGKQLALVFTFNLETWDLVKNTNTPYYAGGPSILPDILPGNTPDFPNYTWREYGQRVGVWRLIDLFDEMGIAASCATNAVTFERRKAMTDAILERGWELLAHNYEQGELLTAVAHDKKAERDIILRSIAIYEKHVGKRPVGWLSSSLRGTLNTAGILAEQGFKFYCDIMNDDQPFMIGTDAGPIIGIPYSNVINDFTMVTRQALTTDQYRDQLIEEFDVLYAEGEHTARIMNIGLHPHVSGRAHRIRAIREFIEHAQKHDAVWWPRREEIADWYAQNHEAHFPGQI